MNTHAIADTMAEIMAREEDLLPACVISTTWPTVPVSSLTLAAFTTQAYVRDGQYLVYADQPAITLTLSSAAGTNWLSITRDTSTAYAGWTRRAGSHYMFQLAGARPPDVDGLLVLASCVVSGGVITAVTPAPGVTRAERWRTLAALGTMAQQDASAVAITGGTAVLTGGSISGLSYLQCNGTALIQQYMGVQIAPATTVALYIGQYKGGGQHGIGVKALDSDVSHNALTLTNVAGGQVGSITYTGTTTAFNTTSDVRLKRKIQELLGGVDAIKRLRPVSYVWNSTDEPDIGFLAHELMTVAPNAVQGLPDAVNPDGTIKPQQVDQSKLIPLLTSAIKELLAQVEALAARVASLEEQLGV